MILVDTNILVAVANLRDTHQEMARDLLEGVPTGSSPTDGDRRGLLSAQ